MRYLHATALVICVGNAQAAEDTLQFRYDGRCPDWDSPACLDYIRTEIDADRYVTALDAADKQCNSNDEAMIAKLAERTLLYRASACHALARLQQLMGHHERAYESRERTQQLARFGCQSGFQSVCEFYGEFLRDHLQSLLAELAYDWTYADRQRYWRPTVRQVNLGVQLPRAFEPLVRRAIESAFAGTNRERRHAIDLTLDIDFEQDDVTMKAMASDPLSRKILWSKRYRVTDLKTRYRFYGMNYREKSKIWSRAVEDYKPLFVNMIGFGVASIPNNAGEELDHHRHTLEIRSSEIFKSRRSAFGILATGHVTKRAVLGVPENEDELPKVKLFQPVRNEESEEVTLLPYKYGYGVYGIYGYSFGGGPRFFDASRYGGHLAIGFFSTADFVAPSAKLGFDFYMGRHWAISAAGLVIGKTTTYFGANAILNETEIGGDFTLSYIP